MGRIATAISNRFFEKRYKRFQQAQFHFNETQEKLFQDFKRKLKRTQFAQSIGLSKIANYEEYLNLVSPKSYEDFRPLIDKVYEGEKNVFFRDELMAMGITSGTSGNAKRIPYNRALLESFRQFRILLGAQASVQNPDLNIISDKEFKYGLGPSNYYEKGILHGYASGILASNSNKYFNRKSFPKIETLKITNWERQIEQIAKETLQENFKIINCMPCYAVHIFKALLQITGKKEIKEIWPELKFMFYSSTPVEPYRQEIDELVGRELVYYGAFAATEVPLAIQVPGNSSYAEYAFNVEDVLIGLSPLEDMNKVIHPERAVLGKEYVVNVGTPNGILQYQMNDKIKIIHKGPIRFHFMGRIGQELNVAGEKTSEKHIMEVVKFLKDQKRLPIKHHFVYPSKTEQGQVSYHWALCIDKEKTRDQFPVGDWIDEKLVELSLDYYEARVQDKVLGPTQVNYFPGEVADRYFRSYQSSGQLKMKSCFQSAEDFNLFINQFQ